MFIVIKRFLNVLQGLQGVDKNTFRTKVNDDEALIKCVTWVTMLHYCDTSATYHYLHT